jgi:hypothetical protein
MNFCRCLQTNITEGPAYMDAVRKLLAITGSAVRLILVRSAAPMPTHLPQ